MQTSTSITKILPALIKAQSEFPAIPKKSTNPFHGSKYADLSAIVETLKPIMTANKLVFSQSSRANGIDSIVIITTIFHESGEFISSELEIPLAKKDAQAVGSAMTYARRYSLTAILGVVADDDDDGNQGSPHSTNKAQNAPNASKPPIKATPTQPKSMNYPAAAQTLAKQLMDAGRIDLATVKKDYLSGKSKFADMTAEEAQAAYNKLIAFADAN